MNNQAKEYHYAIDAAKILLKCRRNLNGVINPPSHKCLNADGSCTVGKKNEPESFSPASVNAANDVNPNALDLDRTLLSIEQLIHSHLLTLAEHNRAIELHPTIPTNIRWTQSSGDSAFGDIEPPQKQCTSLLFQQAQQPTNITLKKTVEELERLSNQKNSAKNLIHHNRNSVNSVNSKSGFKFGTETGTATAYTYRSQSPSFPENVSNIPTNQDLPLSPSSSFSSIPQSSSFDKSALDSLLFRLIVILQLCLVRIDEAKSIIHNQSKLPWIVISSAAIGTFASSSSMVSPRYRHICSNLGKDMGLVGTMLLLRKGWRKLCLNTRLYNTTLSLEDWQQQWVLLQSIGLGEKGTDEQCKHLLDLVPYQRSYGIWGSERSFRYNLVKWIMDCIYASVGTAVKATKSSDKTPRKIWMPITAAAAASYYSIVGPGGKAAEVLSGSESSDLMQNTWGVVSLPAFKTLSLRASRLLKGAAVAERIKICGVSCFILSKNPCPALSTAIRRYRRQQERETFQLGTIFEEQSPFEGSCARAVNFDEYPRKDVIFHLTGGGFFAHTLAGDIPFLLDWSGATNSVVIAIEYALLPEHKFPVAIEEVTKVFASIVSGESVNLLGFQTDKIIVTGESTGGNLATSLCVKLCLDRLVDVEDLRTRKEGEAYTEEKHPDSFQKPSVRLPDALLLCCPALNLSLELSPSRLLSRRDAVLPSTLINTISDAYLGTYSKKDPVASPFYAPDSILSVFPPTLLYASSEDPFLDDSVIFNKRLKRLGVECDLRAAQNLPHAYWGLGTAGFPEAMKVQRECEAWMTKQFRDDCD